MHRILAGALALLVSGMATDALASAAINNRITRVYVSNAALSIVAVGNPSSCPYGIVATDQDPAYDRWISLATLAFQMQFTANVEYDPATCKLISLAVTRP